MHLSHVSYAVVDIFCSAFIIYVCFKFLVFDVIELK